MDLGEIGEAGEAASLKPFRIDAVRVMQQRLKRDRFPSSEGKAIVFLSCSLSIMNKFIPLR